MQEKSSNSSSSTFFTPFLVVMPHDANVLAFALELLQTRFAWTKADLEHPDVSWVNPLDQPVSIEQVRLIPSLVASRPMGPIRFILLANFAQASLPAQNALLKVLEEPPAENQFILLTTSLEMIIPTILSRVQVVPLVASTQPDLNNSEISAIYQKLTTSSYAELITLAEKYTERSEAQTLLNQLISYLHAQLTQATNSDTGQRLTHHLQQVLTAQDRLRKNANVRLVIEDLFFGFKSK